MSLFKNKNMKESTKDTLFTIWADCDEEDKSTEYMFQLMSDITKLPYDRVVDFVIETTDEERQAWYHNQIRVFTAKSNDGEYLIMNIPPHCDTVHIRKKTVDVTVIDYGVLKDNQTVDELEYSLTIDMAAEELGFLSEVSPNKHISKALIDEYREAATEKGFEKPYIFKIF